MTGSVDLSALPLKIEWNRSELMRAYHDIEALRHAIAQPSESPLNASLLAVLNAIEHADIEWDGVTRPREQVSA